MTKLACGARGRFREARQQHRDRRRHPVRRIWNDQSIACGYPFLRTSIANRTFSGNAEMNFIFMRGKGIHTASSVPQLEPWGCQTP